MPTSLSDLTYRDGRLFENGEPLNESLNFSGHKQVWFDGRLEMYHRLIFLHQYGYLPNVIDHINRNPGDNRIENLREITRSYNSVNSEKSWGKIPSRGVHRHSNGKYRARIRKNGKLLCLGVFETMEAASAAYEKARQELFPGAFNVSVTNGESLCD